MIFRDLFTGNLSLPAQAQHVLCVFPTTRVTYPGLTGKEWLKAFALQAVEQGNGGYVGIAFATGLVFVL